MNFYRFHWIFDSLMTVNVALILYYIIYIYIYREYSLHLPFHCVAANLRNHNCRVFAI